MADEADYELNGIQEPDFQRWKYHPVTKVFVRYLLDYERQLCEKQIGMLRKVVSTPDPFTLGMFQGRINTVGELAAVEFADLVEFYGTEEEQEESDAA